MSQVGRALVVDDDAALRVITAQTLAGSGWEVEQAGEGADVARRVREAGFDLLVLDQKLPDADGVELLEELREDGYAGAAVIMTAFPTLPRAARALAGAAVDYLQKPVDTRRLLSIAGQAREGHGGAPSWEFLWHTIEKRHGFLNVLSAEPLARNCYETAARVADSTAGVLLEGETGTGKEYLARAIHYMSERRDRPFVAVNCGAIPEPLVESELFGHEKGAFTSATSAKQGLCEMAEGGTLLLDEVGELTPTAQVKLLRFLQDGTVQRLGAVRPITVNVRVIAATNRDLGRAMREGSFREDLFYRLAVVPLRLPPLRERPGDIPLFARHFLREAARETPRAPREFAPEATERLMAHTWPGNLRELHNVVRRGALLARGPLVRAEHCDVDCAPHPAPATAADAGALCPLAQVEREHIRRVLEHTGGNKTGAARILGISPRSLRTKITAHGLGDTAPEAEGDDGSQARLPSMGG